MKMKPEDKIAMILVVGSVLIVLTIVLGAFGQAFYLAVATGKEHPISESASQLLTALGSTLVGGACGYIGANSSSTPNSSKKCREDDD